MKLVVYAILDFQKDFLHFVAEGVPPNTFDAIAQIINDIMNHSHQGLLSSGFILSILLMTNGVNAVLGGFELSAHITLTRGFFKQYCIALALSLVLSMVLIVTVVAIVVAEIMIQKINIKGYVADVAVIEWSRYAFILLMIAVKFTNLEPKMVIEFLNNKSVIQNDSTN